MTEKDYVHPWLVGTADCNMYSNILGADYTLWVEYSLYSSIILDETLANPFSLPIGDKSSQL